MSNDHDLTEASKFLSYVLRHKPDAIGITLDHEGWADVDALIICASHAGKSIDRGMIDAIVATNDKKRFAISQDGRRIRAVQGHSTERVTIAYANELPPEILYHGTAERFLASILREGLRAGRRHHVHLSMDLTTATAVGRRHGKSVVLTVSAGRMHRRGFAFHRAENGVWLTNMVPPEFLSR